MKKLFTFFVLIALFLGAMAQAPQMFSYQAVVRNSSNTLITNKTVGVRISILQGGAFGNAMYVETHTESTNENGLLIIDVGDGTVQQGSFELINWANGPYFLKSEIDPDGGTDYAVTTIQQLLSVPYSLYAQNAGNGFSGDYNDLTNTPIIPTVPENVSAFINDAGYLTSFTEQQVLSIRQDTIFLTGGSFVKLPVGFDGDYNSLTNTPAIPSVPTNISVFNNDAGYLTTADLPAIPTIPENVSAFNNDVPYLTAEQQILSISNDTVFLTGGSFVKLPEGFDGDYNSLINKPSIFSGDYNDLTNTPDIPQIPANVSAFSNDAGYITNQDCPTVDVCDLYEIIANLQQRIENLENNGWVNPTPTIPTDTTTPIYNPCDTIGFVNDIDGNIYNTVQIGQQCWLKENLRTTRYADGTMIPMGETTSNDVAYRYAPSNNASNVQQYGFLYNWQAASRGIDDANNPSEVQGICPNGWHLPSDAEWTQLTDYVSSQNQYVCGGNPDFIGKPLAAQTGWYGNSGPCNIGNDLSANDATHFSAMPAGYYFGSYYRFKQTAYFWSCTSHDNSYAYGRDMTCQESTVNRHTFFKYNAFSVRCVFNGTEEPQPIDTTVVVPIVPPSVDSTVIGNVTDSTAVVFSELLDDGGDSLVVTGFCWNATGNPTLADNHIESANTTLTFSAIIPALDTCMTYYVRAYATNSAGTVYGPVNTFATPCPEPPADTTVTPIDTTVFECHPFLNIHDTTVNWGAQVTLSVTDTTMGGVQWTWSGGSASGNSITVAPVDTTTYYATSIQLGPELIVNGDFEQGNVGFETECDYRPGSESDLAFNGYAFSDGTDVTSHNGGWVNILPPSGSGVFFLCDASTEYGENAPIVWKQTVHVNPQTQYLWSFKATEVCPSCESITQFSLYINGNNTEYQHNTIERGKWSTIGYLWNSDTTTIVELSLRQIHQNSESGNDFGLDDISFRAVIDSNACVDSAVVKVKPHECTPCEGTPTVTDYDGNVYNTVQIGNQCWTKENMRAKHFADGEAIYAGVSNQDSMYRYYYSNNTSSTEEIYGLLYDYRTAARNVSPTDYNPSGVQGVCPDGWHLPSNSEYDILLNYVNSVDAYKCNGQVGKAFCAPVTWNAHDEECYVGNHPETNNATCFSMVAAGWTGAGGDGGPVDFGITADIWTSTRGDFGTDFDKTGIEWYNHDMGDGYCFSVRCLRNESRMVVTTPIIELSDSMAVCGGSVILANNDLNATISARGVCWAETENSSIEDSHTTDGAEMGSFTSTLTLLQPGTIYHARAYAIIDGEIVYGNQISFKTYTLPEPPQPCPGTPTLTDVDGNVYNTVQIGEQCWMRENLRATHYPDGSEIAVGNNTTAIGIPVYYQNTEYDTLFGLFYTPQAAMYHANGSNNNPSGVQGICPSGWHLPSQAEWEQLHNKVNADYPNEAAKALAANTELWQESATLHTVGNGPLFNNMSGFSALPTGYYNQDDQNYWEFGQRGIFWSSTTSGTNLRYYHFWNNGDNGGFEEVDRHAILVRCLKNPDGMTYLPYVTTDSANLVSDNSITVHGTATGSGEGNVTERGFCWSVSDANPTLEHTHVAVGSGFGSFTHTLSNLEDGGYHIRAYATTDVGVVYGNIIRVIICNDTATYGLACPETPTVTDYDGNVYNTVQIGNQCWMKENLRVMHYADGTVVNGAYHHTDSSVQTIYYLWGSVVNGNEGSNTVPSGIQGVCPTGWHVPSAAEFEILIDYTNIHYVTNSGESTAKALASKEGWNYSTNVAVPGENCHNNTTGFSAVPNGCGYYDVYFQEEGQYAYLSSATPDGGYFKPFVIIADNSQAHIGSHAQWYSFPVRCLRD